MKKGRNSMFRFVIGARRDVRLLFIAAFAATLGAVDADASDHKIALVPGGPHPYFAPWEQAAADAKKDFGIAAVDYKVPAEWKLNQQTELLDSLAAQGYSGFGFFPGDGAGINATLTELKGGGIATAALGGCSIDPTAAAFCLATDPFNTSYVGAKKAIEAMGGKGNLVHLTGQLIDTNTVLREQGVQKAVDETKGAVKLLQTLADTDEQEAGDQKINALLAAKKDQIDGMVATAYITSVVTSKSLRAIGDKRIKFIAFNDDPIILDAIKDGFVTGTVVQNPYGQGYIGAYAMDLLAGGGCSPKADAPWVVTPQTKHFIDSGTLVVGPANMGTYGADLKALTRKIQAGFKDTYLACK
jgi:ribose transport system substrate-binding protein